MQDEILPTDLPTNARGRSRLTATEQAIVTRAIVAEYAWLGVVPTAVAPEVATGRWDDHPVAVRLLEARRRASARKGAAARSGSRAGNYMPSS